MKPYKCDKCDKSYTFESLLKDHKYSHSLKRQYECSICHKTYRRERELKKHTLASHEGKRKERVFKVKCDICGKMFTNKHNHDTHFRRHMGERPFKCD